MKKAIKMVVLIGFALLGAGFAQPLNVPQECKSYTTVEALNRDIPEKARLHLAQQLQSMVDFDQDIRKAMHEELPLQQKLLTSEHMAFLQVAEITDHAGTSFLKKTIELFGWPSSRRTRDPISNNAWLLAQHADLEPDLQKCVLELIKQDMTTPQEKVNFAYLSDRVLLAEGKLQLYGTQVMFQEGKWAPIDLQDPPKVNERRAEMGLEPLETYLERFASPSN